MQQLHCKIGDLAIVVNTELPQNLGQIVEVLGLPTGKPFTMRGHGHVWQVRTASGRAMLHWRVHRDNAIVQYAEGPAPDRCLRPVSGLTDDDAVLTDLGKKQATPRRKTKTIVKGIEEAL